ncbi:hypothetical protein ALC53_10125 [Atta colombica]|uniref:Uncharacterized protein n=1 Tax=Atta colombica TaxID=520822 RepID=A0A151I122_9HYME|nr:hypothetical protein ALC53_10125 [Atta colombica]
MKKGKSISTIDSSIYTTASQQRFSLRVGENTVNGDHSDAHHSTFSQSSKEVCRNTYNIKTTPSYHMRGIGN